MAKQSNQSPVSGIGYEYGLVVFSSTGDRLVGRLLTLIESFGMKDSQEKAAKDLVRQEVWNTLFETGVTIGSKTHTEIRKKYHEERAKNQLTPMGAIEII